MNVEVIVVKHANTGTTERSFAMADILAVRIEPRKSSHKGGYLAMPLWQNIPEGHDGWKLVKCQECGRECWERPLPAELDKGMFTGELCTICALGKGV